MNDAERNDREGFRGLGPVARAFQGAKAVATGLATTLKHAARPQITIGYPEVRPELPPVFRGFPTLPPDNNGNHWCISCNACARVCPPQCIYITSHKGEDKKLVLDDFVIDANLCIMCGLCEEVCPASAGDDKTAHPGKAIQLSHLYEFSGYTHEDLVFHLPQLIELGDEFSRHTSRDLPGKPGTARFASNDKDPALK